MAVRRVDILALVLLALLALVFFWPVTLGLGWIPSGGGDLVSLLWPWYSYAAHSLQAGRLPLWNPTLFSGEAFAANNQTSLFYPINLVAFLLFPALPYTVMEWLVVFHFWLAGAAMYFCMRVLLAETPGAADSSAVIFRRTFHWPASCGPALFSAVAFMFSEVFVTHVGNLNLNAAAAWLPAVFGALHLALTRRSFRWAAAAGGLLAMCILAGHMQMTFIVMGGLGVYALWHIGWGAKSRLRLTAVAVVFGALAFGLTAFVLLPSLEMTQMTARTQLTYGAASSFSIPWAGLAGLFSPQVFGRGPAGFWGPWDRVEVGYVGVLPLVFAGLAPFKNRSGTPLFLGLLGGLSLLTALGSNAPLHRLLYTVVPGFSGMRVPARFILLTDFSLAALGGWGLHGLAAVSRKRIGLWCAALGAAGLAVMDLSYRWAVAAIGVPHPAELERGLIIWLVALAAGAVLAVVSARARRAVSLVALAVLAVDLIGQGAWLEVDSHDPTTGFDHAQAVAFLQSQPVPTRIDVAPGQWAPAASARFGLESITGVNHAFVLAAYQTYLGAVGSRGAPLYNFLNVQFVVADKGQPPGDATLVPVFSDDPLVDVYLNTKAMARVSLVYSATVVANGEAAFGAIHAPDFDPAQAVVVENGPALPGGRQDGASNLYYTGYAPEAYSVVAVAPAPAYLVFSEVWYPGWRAWVDGVEVPIYRANFAFRAVWLASPGSHAVVMRFDPWSWKAGLALTLLTLAGLAACVVKFRLRRPAVATGASG